MDTVIFVNSGFVHSIRPLRKGILSSSEANDLALRMARDFTKHHDAIVVDQSVLKSLLESFIKKEMCYLPLTKS